MIIFQWNNKIYSSKTEFKQFQKLHVKPLRAGFGLRWLFCLRLGLGRETAHEKQEAKGLLRLDVPPTRKFSSEL